MPDKTMASKAAVDLHDHLKRDMMTLFSLEKILQKKVKYLLVVRSRKERYFDVLSHRAVTGPSIL